MGDISIAVEAREGRGKELARKLRASGRVPAVVYGCGREAVSISLDPLVLEAQIKSSQAGLNTLFDLTGEATVAGRTVLVKEIQREPVRGAILHADFVEVDLTERIHVSVPVHTTGTSPGVTMGGVMEHTLREIELACLPGSIPDELVIEVGEVELGQALHVGDLVLPGGVELITDVDLTLLSVATPRGMAEEEEVAEEEIEGEEGDEGEEGAEGAAEGEASEPAAKDGKD